MCILQMYKENPVYNIVITVIKIISYMYVLASRCIPSCTAVCYSLHRVVVCPSRKPDSMLNILPGLPLFALLVWHNRYMYIDQNELQCNI